MENDTIVIDWEKIRREQQIIFSRDRYEAEVLSELHSGDPEGWRHMHGPCGGETRHMSIEECILRDIFLNELTQVTRRATADDYVEYMEAILGAGGKIHYYNDDNFSNYDIYVLEKNIKLFPLEGARAVNLLILEKGVCAYGERGHIEIMDVNDPNLADLRLTCYRDTVRPAPIKDKEINGNTKNIFRLISRWLGKK